MNDRINKLKEIGLYGDYSEEELPNNIIDLIYNREVICNESFSSELFSESSDDLLNDDLDDNDYDDYYIVTVACVLAEYWYIFGD